jgi:prevent-host-death family protein
MTTVSVAVLKQQLSSYLHQVEAGEEVVVTAHHRPVARVVPFTSTNRHIRKPTADMSTLRRLKGVALTEGRTSVELLIEDRAGR